MKKVYIAGAYSSRALTSEERYIEISNNILNAESTAIWMANMGIGFICPHLHTAHFEEKAKAPESFYRELDMDLLAACQGIYMLEGWQKSSGSRAEHDWAMENGLPVFYAPFKNDLLNWYHEP